MKTNKKVSGGIVCVLFFAVMCFFCLPGKSSAVEPVIRDIIISNNTENVLLYARLADCFKPDMESSILAGVPTVFTLQMDVYQERPYIWDKNISSQTISRTIKYDNLKKTFSIYTNGNPEPVVLPDFESAQKAMADFSGISVIRLKALTKGNSYYVMMKVKIDKVRLPLKLEYVLFFVSFWDFETVWYRHNFKY
ncbi:MAG TPA: DUF4390 domain-containing protein [Smithellaceae bacterium]|nr:DUF4390 domain-containing protein [Smithellaceae bacterium]